MTNLFFLFAASILVTKNFYSDFLVSAKILGTASKEKIVLIIEVKNSSNKKVKILNNRTVDYRWDNRGIKSLGNYIVEIEKYENGQYNLFGPSADIDNIPPKEEYISIQNEETISDTLHIMGYLFTRNNNNNTKREFPSGRYRIRVFFNRDMINDDKIGNRSNWIEFNIE